MLMLLCKRISTDIFKVLLLYIKVVYVMNENKIIVFTITILFVLHVLPVRSWTDEILWNIGYMVITIGLAISSYYYFYRRNRKQKRYKDLLSSKMKASEIAIFSLFMFAIDYIGVMLITSVIEPSENDGKINTFEKAVSHVLQAPIVEEVMFRGLVFLLLIHILNKMGVKFKGLFILLSTIPFAFAHVVKWCVLINTMQIELDFSEVVPLLWSGLIFGLLYLITRSLLATISIHMMNNVIHMIGDISELHIDEFVLIGSGIIFFVIGVYYMRSRYGVFKKRTK
ncbi:CPBP family intramembrane metalloprotease [Mammaliicoccus lentus]|nr:CPBP family intramembrane metalloprotease [Mammaliicoccus lentus]